MNKISTCMTCMKEFKYCDKSSLGKFCSNLCKYGYSKIKKNCLHCNNEFISNKVKKRKYCTISCYNSIINQKHLVIKRLRDNYEKKVIKKEGCWEWIGSFGYKGYGKLSYHNKKIGAHRASWMIHKGPIPNKLFVLHACHNPPCTNPEHLYIGDQKRNMEDCSKAGRAKGKNSYKGKSNE